LETYFRNVKSLISRNILFSFLFKLNRFLKLLYKKVTHKILPVFQIIARKTVINLLVFGAEKTLYIKKLIIRKKKVEYKVPVKGILHYINPFRGTQITLQVLCLISITYAFHLMFIMVIIPVLDTIVSPTNIMIGLLKDKIGIKLALTLCFVFTLDAIFFFNLPYTITFLTTYQLNKTQSIGVLLGMLSAGTVIRFFQSIAWYNTLKKWII
jgi:hypothetical protein